MNLICPTFCLHCREKTGELICLACKQHLLLEPPSPAWYAAAFQYIGPAKALIDAFCAGHYPGLAPALAGYMAVQMDKLKWPAPDLIVPIPERWIRLFDRTYSPAGFLAKELGKIWNAPVENLLKRRWGGFSQSKLSFEERRRLSLQAYQWRKRKEIKGKIILLIDDLAITGATLRVCMRRLKEGHPSSILGLTFACQKKN